MNHSSRAFTVVELLLVIAIVALLLSIVIVAMGGVRNAANRTESSNALRQMIAGYNSYSADHSQNLMPGYVEESRIGDQDNQIDLTVRIPGSSADMVPGDTAGYVWRLAPYLDDAWRTMFIDYRNRAIMTKLQAEFDGSGDGTGRVFGPATAEDDDLGIASVPSFGLNSIFVGGDTSHGGQSVVDRMPWQAPGHFSQAHPDRLAATRLSEVRNPSQLIVFGPVARADATAEPGTVDPYEPDVQNTLLGYVELRPPFTESTEDDWSSWTNQQWTIGLGGRIESVATGVYGNGSVGAGLPIVRWGTTQYPVAHLDGSTVIEDIGRLSTDMRRWSPFVTGLDQPAVSGAGGP